MQELREITSLDFLARNLDILVCPACGFRLRLSHAACECIACARRYPIEDGVPRLFRPNESADRDITRRVREFYNQAPFPDYDECDDIAVLIHKARTGGFAQMLDDALPPGVRILDCGCGTGQLSAFLSLPNRTVFGADISMAALTRSRHFQQANHLRNVCYIEMNLFRPAFRPAAFDVVMSMGVFHHTANPLLGLRTLAPLLRPGGYCIFSLYHRWGRLATHARRLYHKSFGGHRGMLKKELPRSTSKRRRAWLRDQYAHPHESSHTLEEVLRWLPSAELDFVCSVPGFASKSPLPREEGLFSGGQLPAGLRLKMREMAAVWKLRRDGGLFVVIARKT